MGGPGATIEDDGPERPESYAGKIVAPPCRTALFAPSDWNGAAARTSNAPPEEDLELEWAHGVSVAGGAGMLKWAPKWRADDPSSSFGAAGETREENAVRKRAEGWWVYACGAMGVALETAATTPRLEREVRETLSSPTRRASRSSQRFFRGHDERVTSLDVHPSGRWAATGQAGRVPQVAVWEIASGREVARVRLAAGDGRVAAVAFGPGDGDVAPAGSPRASSRWPRTRARLGFGIGAGGSLGAARRSSSTSPSGSAAAGAAASRARAGPRTSTGSRRSARSTSSCGSRATRRVRRRASGRRAAARDAARTARLRERSARVGEAAALGTARRVRVRRARRGGWRTRRAARSCPPTPRAAGALVTGHADGTLVVWRGRRAARVVDAHPGAPTRCLALRTIVAEDKGDGEEGEDGGEARGERRREEEGEDGGLARPLVRVEIITGSDGGTVRRWDLVDEAEGEDGARAFARSSSDDENENENENERGRRLETEHVFAFQTGPAIVLPTDAPAVSSDASEYRRDDSGPDADLAFRTLPAPPRRRRRRARGGDRRRGPRTATCGPRGDAARAARARTRSRTRTNAPRRERGGRTEGRRAPERGRGRRRGSSGARTLRDRGLRLPPRGARRRAPGPPFASPGGSRQRPRTKRATRRRTRTKRATRLRTKANPREPRVRLRGTLLVLSASLSKRVWAAPPRSSPRVIPAPRTTSRGTPRAPTVSSPSPPGRPASSSASRRARRRPARRLARRSVPGEGARRRLRARNGRPRRDLRGDARGRHRGRRRPTAPRAAPRDLRGGGGGGGGGGGNGPPRVVGALRPRRSLRVSMLLGRSRGLRPDDGDSVLPRRRAVGGGFERRVGVRVRRGLGRFTPRAPMRGPRERRRLDRLVPGLGGDSRDGRAAGDSAPRLPDGPPGGGGLQGRGVGDVDRADRVSGDGGVGEEAPRERVRRQRGGPRRGVAEAPRRGGRFRARAAAEVPVRRPGRAGEGPDRGARRALLRGEVAARATRREAEAARVVGGEGPSRAAVARRRRRRRGGGRGEIGGGGGG